MKELVAISDQLLDAAGAEGKPAWRESERAPGSTAETSEKAMQMLSPETTVLRANWPE